MLILLVKFLIGFIQLLIFGFLFSDAYHLGVRVGQK
nr:MAG TPA: Photosystem II reaction centre I protein (PSII 4.8 kDa protein) [Caudoviricetes sp.]